MVDGALTTAGTTGVTGADTTGVDADEDETSGEEDVLMVVDKEQQDE
jgi:hypothetical protein